MCTDTWDLNLLIITASPSQDQITSAIPIRDLHKTSVICTTEFHTYEALRISGTQKEFWKSSCECRLEQNYQNLFCFLLLCLLCIFSCLYSVLFLFLSVPLVHWFIYLFSFYILFFVWIHPVFVLFSNILEFNYSNCSLFTTTPSLLITC